MNRKHGRILSLALIALALTLAVVVPVTSAENNKQAAPTQEEIRSVIDTQTDSSLTETPLTAVAESAKLSVVGVNNYQEYSYSRSRGFSRGGSNETVEQLAGTGSGVVFYPEYVITNYHVVENASRVTVSALNAQEELAGVIVDYDEAMDIAVVYVSGLDAPAAPLGDSDQLQVGEWAICVGNPLSEELRSTVTVGIVSALDREIESTAATDKYGLKTTHTNYMIQTDAAINAGNSGGGLFNTLGQLMGIPTLKYSGSIMSGASIEGIGMAIPINSAKPMIEKALTGHLTDSAAGSAQQEENGRSPSAGKPRLGITYVAITKSNTYEVYMGALPAGAMITEVAEGSAAEKAGLLPDDIIVEADGVIVSGNTDLSGVMSAKRIGDTMKIKIYRAENLREAESIDELTGEYIDIEVLLENS